MNYRQWCNTHLPCIYVVAAGVSHQVALQSPGRFEMIKYILAFSVF